VSDVDNYDESQNAVVLMTLHSAKGLEFPVVFVCGMERGLFPGFQAELDYVEMEEERRLCYVGITRAKRKLYLTYAKQRTLYGKTESRWPSGFLNEIPKNLIDLIEEPKAQMPAGRVYHFDDAPQKVSPRQNLQSVLDTYQIGTATRSATTSAVVCDLKKGDRVSHRKFGEGMVLSVRATADDTELEISFDRVGTRTLMASFAKLTKI